MSGPWKIVTGIGVAATVVIAAAAVYLAILLNAVIAGLGSAAPQSGEVFVELSCASYGRDVLELTKAGYSAAQIEALVTDAANRTGTGERTSALIETCGTPEHILETVK